MVIVMIHARDKGESARRIKEIVEIEAVVPETGKARTNDVYRWSPKEDKFNYKGVSWYLQQLAVQKGVETSDMIKEIQRRKELLEFIQKNGITNYRKVVSLISEYRKNPGEVINKIKSESKVL